MSPCRHPYRRPHPGGGWDCPDCGAFLVAVPPPGRADDEPLVCGRGCRDLLFGAVLLAVTVLVGCADAPPTPRNDEGIACPAAPRRAIHPSVERTCAFASHPADCTEDTCPGGAEYDANMIRRSK